MKKFLFLCLLIANVSYGQIFVQSGNDGSIVITPKGLQGKSSSSTDTSNVALGASALKSNTIGFNNTVIGSNALSTNMIGSSNIAIGYKSLYSTTTSSFNTAIGTESLYASIYGGHNTAVGHQALYSTTYGGHNTACGSGALYLNRTGSENTAMGAWALNKNTTGTLNASFGFNALNYNDYGSGNTALGHSALKYNTTGGSNTAVGLVAGSSTRSAMHCTFIGANADAADTNYFNSMALGAYAIVNASNKVRIGSPTITVIEGAVPFSTPSDRRLKQNIVPSLLGLSFISRLAPMSYTYIADKTNVRRDGLIAQDVEKAMQELGVEFSGLQKSPDGTYSLAYSDFVMPLINAVKEQQIQMKNQQEKIDKLEKLVETLLKTVGSKQ